MNCAKCSQDIPYDKDWRGNNHRIIRKTYPLCNDCDDMFREILERARNLLFLKFMGYSQEEIGNFCVCQCFSLGETCLKSEKE